MRALLFIVSLLTACVCRASGDERIYLAPPPYTDFLSFHAHYGFIMAHNPNMAYLIKSHIGGIELDLIRTPGTRTAQWERIYKRPEKGLGFYCAELGNRKELGQAVGMFGFVNFPLNPGRKFKLYVRSGDGIGLVTKPYDRVTNHKNNVNGTYVNVLAYLRLMSVFNIGRRARLDAGFGLTHLSNGNWAQPNLGINLMTMNLGLTFNRYQRSNYIYDHTSDTVPHKFTRKPFVTATITGGVNELSVRNGKKYGTYFAGVCGWKPVSPKSRWGFGLDLFYDFGNIARAEEGSKYYTSKPGLTNLQAGLHLGYEFVVGKFALPMEMGSYFYSKSTGNGPLYHKVGVRCYLTDHLILNYSVKTHWVTAENLEFGVGYKF